MADLTNAWVAPARQQFFDEDGHPLSLGYVYMFELDGTTPKDTWKDPDMSVLNSHPIVLDAGGWCEIWGEGAYRQRVTDALGNEIWDKETGTGDTEGAAGGNTYSVYFSVFMWDLPEAGQIYPIYNILDDCRLLADLSDCIFTMEDNPLASFPILVKVNGSTIATITFDTSGVPTVSGMPANVDLSAGDKFSLEWPDPQDGTGGNIALSFKMHLL